MIETEAAATPSVLATKDAAPDARLREIMTAFVRHLDDFAREQLTTSS